MIRNLKELMDYLDNKYSDEDIIIKCTRNEKNIEGRVLPVNIQDLYEYTGLSLEIFDDCGNRIDVFYRIRPINHGGTVLYIR